MRKYDHLRERAREWRMSGSSLDEICERLSLGKSFNRVGFFSGCSSEVEYSVWGGGAAGSNPVIPTISV